jgi:hypothetical protein
MMVIGAGYVLALTGVLIFGTSLKWPGVNMAVNVSQVAGLLAPVAFAAAVVERGVEIVISPWRAAGATALQKALASANAIGNAAATQQASDALDSYKATTQRYAFAISLGASILVSISGVRALGPFVDLAVPKTALAGSQLTFFQSLDVALTALLLSGGADGVHSVVNAVTSFFDKAAKP